MIVAVVVLGLTVLALLVERHLERRRWEAEREAVGAERLRLTNAVIARHPGELAALNRPARPVRDPEDEPAPRPRPIGM
jgi:hypothetical protein